AGAVRRYQGVGPGPRGLQVRHRRLARAQVHQPGRPQPRDQGVAMADEAAEPVILREVTGPVAVLTLNRPKARNALDDGMRETLRQELEALSADPDVRVIVLTGAGRAFCAGGDIKSMR